MILVTGGLGFIGSHTVRALLDRGQQCVLVQRRSATTSPVLDGADHADIAVARADVADLAALRSIGEQYPITGIVHLSGSMPYPLDESRPIEQTREALGSYFNLMQVAQEWGVRRVGVASTIGIYGGSGATGALREDAPLPLQSPHLIPRFKKIAELLGDHLNEATDIEVVNYRISGTWGPLGHLPDPFFAAPSLALAAARGTTPDLTAMVAPAHSEDGLDLCYVKDTARAIAMLQLADQLSYRTYNVASGRSTSNADVIKAIRETVPDAQIDLPAGGSGADTYLDISRLREDTGYQPQWNVQRAAADYIEWLRAGHDH